MNLLAIFLTGLTAGGLSCLAVQGGLLASVLINQKKQSTPTSQLLPTMAFLVAKLFSHTILGFLLGGLGGVIALSLGLRLTFQVLTALFMLATAFNLLKLHPIFRYVAIKPPKFLQRLVRKSSHSQAVFAPAFLGLLTIFVPCGVTQAMEVLAISIANPLQSALIMFSFVLGTFPTFMLIGVLTSKFSHLWQQIFNKVAALVLILMSLYSLNGVLLVLNSPLSLSRLLAPVLSSVSPANDNRIEWADGPSVNQDQSVQKVVINISNRGYTPNLVKVKKGLPVELTLVSKDTYSCALAFVFREFGINTMLKSNDTQTFKFTPEKKGEFVFTCSMGMYSGTLKVE